MTAVDNTRLESLRQVTQEQVDALKSLSERNRLGQFATPIPLAREIVLSVLPHLHSSQPIQFLEPALGTGAFYSALLGGIPRERIRSATGVEIDPKFAEGARAIWNDHGLMVVNADFTQLDPEASCGECANLILANPPYVRHHHLGREQKLQLRTAALKATNLPVSGLSGLYVYFILLAHRWLADDGVAAWLIPSEWMDVNYGEALRRYFTEEVTLHAVHRFDPASVQFDDALVSSTVVIFRKRKPDPDASVAFSSGGTLSAPAVSEEVPIAALRASRKWSSLPHTGGLRTSSAEEGVVLADLFDIRRGIATGANEFFIMPREQARTIGLPERWLRPILPAPRYMRQSVIPRDEDGYPQMEKQYVLVNCDLPEEAVRRDYQALWSYLQTARQKGILERFLVRSRSPWYKQEKRSPARILCTYIGRGSDGKSPFRFILNWSDAIVPNVYLMLYPKGPLASLLEQHPDYYPNLLAALEGIAGERFRSEGRVYGGGMHKIEPRELGRIQADDLVTLLGQQSTDIVRQMSLCFDTRPERSS